MNNLFPLNSPFSHSVNINIFDTAHGFRVKAMMCECSVQISNPVFLKLVFSSDELGQIRAIIQHCSTVQWTIFSISWFCSQSVCLCLAFLDNWRAHCCCPLLGDPRIQQSCGKLICQCCWSSSLSKYNYLVPKKTHARGCSASQSLW